MSRSLGVLWGALLLAGAGLASLAVDRPLWAQDGPADRFGPWTVVPAPREMLRALDEADALLAQFRYPDAIGLLQPLWESPEDFLMGPSREGLSSSLKQEVLQRWRAMPRDGRQAYELQYGAAALRMWQQYAATADPAFALEVARRYPLTDAAQRAAAQLAALRFDERSPLSAARWWDDISSAEPAADFPLEHTAAWWLATGGRRGGDWLQQLAAGQNPQRRWQARPADAPFVAQLTTWLGERWPASPQQPLGDWQQIRGDAARNAVAEPAGPVGGIAWRFDTLQAGRRSVIPEANAELLVPLVNRIEEALRINDRLHVPASQPLVAGGLVITRTAEHIVAVDAETGTLRWRTAAAHVMPLGARQLAPAVNPDEPGLSQAIRTEDLRQRLFRDQTFGTLACDGRWVYAIESSPATVPRDPLRGLPIPPILANKLTAYDLASGRMVWEIGGREGDEAGPFAGCFFQGPPLVANDRLYCLVEVSGEQRLLQLRRSQSPPGVQLEWSQVLSAAHRPLGWSPQRQWSGQSPAFAGDVLVCPTTSGLVVAVDPERRRLLWGYRYATHDVPSLEPRGPNFGNPFRQMDARPMIDEEEGFWLDTLPTIASTRVVLTPRDSMELHCLDLLTGELLWKRPRENGLYVAGIDGDRVVVVGRTELMAWRLDDGQPAWTSPLTIPAPGGRGLLLAGRYLLPTDSGEILAVDLRSGRLIAQSRLPNGQPAGNLVAANGVLVSQSVRELVAFRSLPEIERQIASALATRPDDAEALALRGELRIFAGDEAAGVADLRKSLAVKPNRQASRVLAGVLIEGLKKDFAHYRSLLEEIDRVAVDPQLRAEFLQLLADGHERQGNHAAAFAQYLKLTGIVEFEQSLERVSGVHLARGDRMVRGRAQAAYQAATSPERTEIDRLLRQHLEEPLPMIDRLDRDLRFLRFFAEHPLADDVRRRVVDRLPADRQPERRRELLRLADSPQPPLAAYAAAQLARGHLDRREFAEARPWGQMLAAQYAAVAIGDEGNAASLVQRWSQEFGDRWPLSSPTWPSGPIEPLRQPRVNGSLRRIARMETVGPLSPPYHGCTFELHDDVELSVVARDVAGRWKWAVTLPEEMIGELPRGGPPTSAARLFCAGTTLAVWLGPQFAVLDVPAGKTSPVLLWHRSLTPQDASLPVRGVALPQTEILNSGRRRMTLGDRQGLPPYGQVLGLSHDQLCYHLGGRLTAVDPQTGQTVWMRQDAPRRVEGTSDGRFVTLFDIDRQQAIVYRAADGVELGRRLLPDPHDWVWFLGDRVVTLRPRRGELLAELHELSSDRTLWRRELAATARCTVVDNRELLCLDTHGRMTTIDLATGRTLWEQETPAIERLSFLWAARHDGRYRVVAGEASPLGPDKSQLRIYDGNQVPFTGQVLQVDPGRNEVTWTAEIPPSAFEFLQPASAPVLAFVGRVLPAPNQAGGVFPPAVQVMATFVDVRDGTVVYQTTESPHPTVFQWEIEGEHNLLRANFLGWTIDFQVTTE